MKNFMKTIINAIKHWTMELIEKLDSKYLNITADLATLSELQAVNDVANSAQNLAEAAHGLAESAKTVADNAQGLVESAQASVNEAKSIAESAQSSANGKMDKNNPTGTGSFSMNRKSGIKIGDYSHAEGYNTIASNSYSHAEGYYTTASGDESHAEGYSTIASGSISHAEGYKTNASGLSSHAEGESTTASGQYSHAEGYYTTASGHQSHAEGNSTTTQTASQHVQGEYNILDKGKSAYTRGEYAHIVGNGTSKTARSNAHTLDWEGNAWYQGDVYVGSTSGTNKDDGSKKLATEDYVDAVIGGIEIPEGGDIDPEAIKEAVDEYLEANPPVQGMTSWNDLTDKPFGENQDGVVTPLDEKYLPKSVPVIFSATTGQIASVKSVDGDGKPTEWETIDMPQGEGDGREWIPLIDVTLEEAVTRVRATKDLNGNPFSVREIRWAAKLLKTEDVDTTVYFDIGTSGENGDRVPGIAHTAGGLNKNDWVAYGLCSLVGTKLRMDYWYNGTTEYNATARGPYGKVLSGVETSTTVFDNILVGFTNSSYQMPVGSIIKVWGR